MKILIFEDLIHIFIRSIKGNQMSYKYLVVSALQEELDEFMSKMPPNPQELALQANLSKFKYKANTVEILTFTADKMGMPYNAAKLMQVILAFKPRFVFFIGICAGISEKPLGAVLIPKRAFSYESGKYEKGHFLSDYEAYELSDSLRKHAQALNNQNSTSFGYEVIINEDLCSGAAVIDDETKITQIKQEGARKLSGLDMESYSVACINHIMKTKTELLVIKAISDKAINKEATVQDGSRDAAKANAADFALRLIRYMEEKNIGNGNLNELTINYKVSPEQLANLKLKIQFTITNTATYSVVIHSKSFDLIQKDLLDNRANRPKPLFHVNQDHNGKDLYNDMYVLKPNKTIKNCWIAIDEAFGAQQLLELVAAKKVGVWHFHCNFLDEYPYSREYSLEI